MLERDKQTRDHETREHDRGKRGQPANDGSLQDFFGGVRRCRQRATDIYAGPGGGRSSRELERFRRKWRSASAYADTQVEVARKQERRVEGMLTANLRYVLRSDEHKQELQDMRIERSANLRTIDALRAGLSPVERRLTAEILASNGIASSLRRRLADMTASQQGKIDLETLSARQPGTCQGCVQLLRKAGTVATATLVAARTQLQSPPPHSSA